MVMKVTTAAEEIAELTKDPDPEEGAEPEKKDAPKEAKAKSEEDKSEKAGEKGDGEDASDFAKRLRLTPEQHRAVTELIKREVGKKHRQAREAEEFAAERLEDIRIAEERAEKAERERDAALQAATPKKETPAKPERASFKTQEEFDEAMSDWKADRKVEEREAQRIKDTEKAHAEEVLTLARERVALALELVPDYEKVTSEATENVPTSVAAYMQESPLIAELGYHFAQHPEDCKTLNNLPQRTYSDLLRMGIALGKIESKIRPFADKAKANGASTERDDGDEPSEDTDDSPSEPREAAPVIEPLAVVSSSQVRRPAGKMNYQQGRAAWEQKHGRDLSRRVRH